MPTCEAHSGVTLPMADDSDPTIEPCVAYSIHSREYGGRPADIYYEVVDYVPTSL